MRPSLPQVFLLALAGFLLGSVPARGQAAPPPEKPAAEAPAKESPKVVRERAYYVPFEKIEDVFEHTGRGIFLPYEEFLELWERGQPKPPAEEAQPPADAVVRGGTYRGSVEGDVARFEVTYAIESLKKGWGEVRLPLGGVAVESVELSDPRVLFSAAKGGYTVYLPEAGAYEVKLKVSARVNQEPGRKSFAFGIPATAVSRLELTIPEDDIRVDVKPSLVVTQTEKVEEGGTKVLAFLGNATEVQVSWMPPVGKVADGGAILFARQQVRAYLGERILRVATDIDYEVLRGEVDALRIRMPENTRILSVKGDNMREWAPEGDMLTIGLHAPIKKRYRLQLSFERILSETPDTLSIPFPRTEDVLRESGWAVLGYDDGLIVRVSDTGGLSQLDPDEVPQALRAQLGLGFRYLAHPLKLDVAIEKITPVVRAATVSVVTLGKEEDQWLGWIDYAIAKAGIFRLTFAIPDTWTVDTVGDPSTVEEFQSADQDGTRTVTVSLKSKALGAFRLPFRLVREGTAKLGELDLSPPLVGGVEQDRGLFGVTAPRALEVTTRELVRLIDADVDELFRTGIMGQVSNVAGIPRTYRYREQPASAKLTLKEKKTEIDVLAQHLVEVADGEIRITHLLDYNVLHAPVPSLQFTAPSALDETLKVEAKQKTEVSRTAREDGLTLWTVQFQPPVLGAVTLTLTHSVDLQGLVAGKVFTYEVPLVHAAGVRGEQGFVAVRKEGTLEIAPRADGMEVMDQSDLPDKLRRGQIYSTFRYFSQSPTLALDLTRYDYEQLATTVIQLLHMKSVLSAERRLKTEAILFVQNTERQYLEVQLSKDARLFSLWVAGRSQAPRKRKDGAGTLIQIPRSAGPRGTFPIVLVYEERLDEDDMGSLGTASLQTLEVLDSVPISKTELELYVPTDYVYMGWSGNLYPRDERTPGIWSRFKELATGANALEDAGRRQGVTRLAPPSGSAIDAVIVDVPTEGYRRYRFDTLAPRAELRFVFMGVRLYWFLDFLCFALAIALSFTLLTRPPFQQAQLRTGLVLIFVCLVLTWLPGGPASSFFASALLGSLLVCSGLLGRHVYGRWQDRRAARLRMAPDPFIEDAPSAAPAAVTVTEPAAPPTESKDASGKEAPEEKTPEQGAPEEKAPEPEAKNEDWALPKEGPRTDQGQPEDEKGDS